MQIAVPRETHPGEKRVALLPDGVARLRKLGADVAVEAGVGATLLVDDAAYAKAGATVVADRAALLGAADLVLRVRPPAVAEVAALKAGAVHVSFLDPFNAPALVAALAARSVSALSLELLPRTTLAQKMDALSSQASLAGYAAVVLAAARLNKVLPMMMTPAGTIPPSRDFVLGAGVAGLQAIATARRLGARVEAFDVRPAVEEQVQSLGARFVKIDLGETGEAAGGYAKELTPAQLERQRAGLAKVCAAADIVITTAQVFGRPAPRLVTAEMLRGMQPGAVVVDLAVESGGNVEGSRPDEEVLVNGVHVLGCGNLPAAVAAHASLMYSNNLVNLVEHFWDREQKAFALRRDDELLKGCLVTHGGAVVHPRLPGPKPS